MKISVLHTRTPSVSCWLTSYRLDETGLEAGTETVALNALKYHDFP